MSSTCLIYFFRSRKICKLYKGSYDTNKQFIINKNIQEQTID